MRPFQLHVDGGLLGSNAGIGLTALARYSLLEVGAATDSTMSLGPKRYLQFGPVAGLGVNVSPRVRLHLLGEFGWKGEYVNRSAFISDDPGTSGNVQYAGVRAGAEWSASRPDRRTRLTLSAWVFARQDLDQYNVSYSYIESQTDMFSGKTTYFPQQSVQTIGGQFELGATFRVGFDITP